MYFSGDISNFESRLHQLPTGFLDLTTGFLIEGGSYTGNNQLFQNNKWNREFNRKIFQFNGQPETGRWFI